MAGHSCGLPCPQKKNRRKRQISSPDACVRPWQKEQACGCHSTLEVQRPWLPFLTFGPWEVALSSGQTNFSLCKWEIIVLETVRIKSV